MRLRELVLATFIACSGACGGGAGTPPRWVDEDYLVIDIPAGATAPGRKVLLGDREVPSRWLVIRRDPGCAPQIQGGDALLVNGCAAPLRLTTAPESRVELRTVSALTKLVPAPPPTRSVRVVVFHCEINGEVAGSNEAEIFGAIEDATESGTVLTMETASP